MSNDNDWVEDVRRWCVNHPTAGVDDSLPVENTDFALGYEAAHPALQARHWPDLDSPSTI